MQVTILRPLSVLKERSRSVEVCQNTQRATEVVLVPSCRETSLDHRRTERLGNQTLLCLAWTTGLEKCLALEALCTHERTH